MGRSFRCTVGELARGWVLAPERYDPARRLDGERTVAELADADVPARRPGELPAGPLLVLDTNHVVEGFILPSGELVAREACRSSRRVLRPGDVVVSRLRPYLRQVAWIDPALFDLAAGGNGVVASPELLVLRSRGEVDLAALVPWLLSAPVQDALAAAQEGGHHPRVPLDALLALGVPEAVLADAARLAAEWRSAAGGMRAALATRARLVGELG